jgi:type II secretory pathway pseudopilin PulG
MAVASAVGALTSIVTGQQQKKAAEAAARQAQENAARQEKTAQEQFNRANQKRPDTVSLLDAAQQASRAGPSGTMLTGPQGVTPDMLTLGKNTLLGS